MAYRNIFIANRSKLSLRNSQLIIDNGEEFSFPIEDIRSVLVDDCTTTLTCKLLGRLASEGVCVILCDEKHTPSAVLQPLGSYCRLNKRILLQAEQSKPKLKRTWQQIVTAKIANQAKCLELNRLPEAATLAAIAKTVTSGDATNRESYAARLYFRALFGNDFTRDDETVVNAALNYGYAILRSFISKTVVAYGLEPSLGIHHKNQLNAFNLSDDIIEPFRPIVDNFVYKRRLEWGDTFATPQKAELLLLLNSAVLVNEKRHAVANAIELLVQSVISSFEKEEAPLKLPALIEYSLFDYD